MRVAGALMLGLPVLSLIWIFVGSAMRNESHSEGTTGLLLSLFAIAVFGVPGGYIAFKGPLENEKSRANRINGLQVFLIGAILLFGGLVDYFAPTVAWVGALRAKAPFPRTGFGWIPGVFGGLMVGMGLACLLSGRDVFKEMGQQAEASRESKKKGT